MKTISLRALSLLLVLGAQVFAQKFTSGVPERFPTIYHSSSGQTLGYNPSHKQNAVLGEENSSYANILLLAGPNTSTANGYNVVNSHGNVFGEVYPITYKNVFVSSTNDTIYDRDIGGVLVLDSLGNGKKTATVLFSSLRKLIVAQITVSEANTLTYSILRSIDMPEVMWQADGAYEQAGRTRRLALLGTSQNGAYKTYHIAISNPLSKNRGYEQSGRVDFFSLNENSWTFSQLNYAGLASNINGLFFEANAKFGADLVSIGDLDKNGYNDLAVLLPASAQYPNSAIYIFFMDNEWMPSAQAPKVLTGSSKQSCNGLGTANWGGEGTHLLVSCNANVEQAVNNVFIKSISIKHLILDSIGDIRSSSVFFKEEASLNVSNYYFGTTSNPLSFKNHKNDLYAVSCFVNGPLTVGISPSTRIIPVIDADHSKNFSLEAGRVETIVNLDSLFYKSGTTGFSVKTLAGLVQCGIQSDNLLCEGEEKAIGSWSTLELSSRSGCDAYKECKRRDTIFVYVRSQNESAATALRVPKSIVIPFFKQVNLGNPKSRSYFRNPDLLNTGVSWNANGLKLSTATSNLSIIPFSQGEGIDTLVFNLSLSSTTDNYPVYLHIVDTAKIFEGTLQDTIWNTAQKRYFALPSSNTYDIAQDSLGIYAEIIGDYLHILKVDVADIFVAYTENAEIKYRKITLMPGAKPQAPTSIAYLQTQKLSAMQVKGGVQISGVTGEFELVSYNLKGAELQRTKSQGSGFVKLRHGGVQITRIKAGDQTIYVRLVN